jgi:mannan endo-1,4-beta-mannosidase
VVRAALWLALLGGAACGRIGYEAVARPGSDGAAGEGGDSDSDASTAIDDGGVLEAGMGSCADAGPPCGVLVVQYESAPPDHPTDRAIRPRLNVLNNGTANISLTELTIRYWYTEEAPAPQTWACDFSNGVPCDDFTVAFSTVVPARTGAGDAFDIGFLPAAGTLAPGGQTQAFGLRLNKTDSSNYDQTNDYSYQQNVQSLTDSPKITLYRNGVLVWGTEPP